MVSLVDVPSPVDFHDPAQALAWVESTVENRPWRPEFFSAIAASLSETFADPVHISELGSGPGHLAKVILEKCKVLSYTAIDFSEAMHDLARNHLSDDASKVTFVLKDFGRDDWNNELTPVQALITMQAAHEVRHKSRLPKLFEQMYEALVDGGLLLFCDHYAEEGSKKNPDLFLTRQEQPAAFQHAGFVAVESVLDRHGMALYRAFKP